MDSAVAPQFVLAAAAAVGEPEDASVWLDERLFPAYLAAASLATLTLHEIWVSKHVKKLRAKFAPVELEDDEEVATAPGGLLSRTKKRIERVGGGLIFSFKLARLGAVLALLALMLYTPMRHGWTLHDIALVATQVYASFLAAVDAFAPARRGRVVPSHLCIVTLAIGALYVYRDLWPIMTYTLHPADGHEGKLLWAKVVLAAFAGIIEPIFEPYPYIPYDPKTPMEIPSPEQTASIFMFLTYVFLDPTIWRAYRLPHLPHDQLPPLCDYDEARHLKARAYPHLDPFSGASKGRNLFWGIVKIFRRSLIFQSIILLIFAFARMATPVATNRLLDYLERRGEGAVVRPWVWIVCLAIGPLTEAITFQMYIFLSTGSLVRVESIMTSLVFDHALRIRLKAETSDTKEAPADGGAALSTPSDGKRSNTPESAGGDEDDDTIHSRTTTDASAATTSTVVASSSSSTQATPSKADAKKAEAAQKEAKEAKAKASNLVGKINNLVTSDLDNINGGRDFLFVVQSAPTMVILSMWFLYVILGWSAFVGLGVMILLAPVPTWVASLMSGVQKEKMKATDGRIQGVTEVMSVLRMIKLFGWERRVKETVAEKREIELGWVWKRKVLNLANSVVNNTVPLVHMVVTYAVYTMVMKKDLSAAIVFSSMTAFDMLRTQMFRVFWGIPQLITANVSLGRVADFLRNTELLDAFTESSSKEVIVDASAEHVGDIGFGRANFSWSNEVDDGTLTPSQKTFRLRIDEDVKFKHGVFNLIIGPTGSGKTSVLMALLHEMHYIPLGPDSWVNLPREGGIAYAAQESWVQSETIKENILFGSPFDEQRYKKVIHQCGLARDLTLFEAGDATEVGEKGLTLSGGQKARITLARAVYSPAKIILLDDVLAALDVHTSRWIVDKCFKGDLLRGRTVLLVTHNIAMASPIADFVVSLSDGHIVSQGSVSDALQKDAHLAEEVKHEEEALELEEDVEGAEAADGGAKAKDGKLTIAEEIAIGHVSWPAFKLFLSGLGGKWPIVFWVQYLGGSISSNLFSVMEMWWLGYWARQYTLQDPSTVKVSYYLGMYTVIVLINIVSFTYAQLIYTYGGLRASRTIHATLVESLLTCTFRWLDVTPTSRVIARCTQDIQAIDSEVANNLNYLSDVTLTMIIRLASVLVYTPIFLFPAVFIAAVGLWIGQVYMKAQLSVKREMSNAKAPVLGIFGGAISGLTSIRAYGAQQAFRTETLARVDRYIRAARSFYNLNRWVSIRVDALGQLFSMSLAFYLVYATPNPDPSNVGFILTMSVSFTSMILYWVRVYNEFEISGNSLERIQQYVDIEKEVEPKDSGNPPASWPTSGELVVENLSARYSSDGPKVLEEVTFRVKAGERVGIVGRTGSGKSTLTLALLRCIITEGSVTYDGIETTTLNLDSLRSNITIIPQVPELLSGTLRHNLDLFGQYEDAVLNDALRSAGLFSLQKLSDENRLTLDSQIASGGGNLSVGQRQIIALARAIVRQSKLLILDEATSAIDYETDIVIQSSLRNELSSDVTVITVAHRLQTIMDYDKIMVLDAGRLVEYDSPKTLLQKDGLLRALVDESADKEALYAMADK